MKYFDNKIHEFFLLARRFHGHGGCIRYSGNAAQIESNFNGDLRRDTHKIDMNSDGCDRRWPVVDLIFFSERNGSLTTLKI